MAVSAEHLDLGALKLAFLQFQLARIAAADRVVSEREWALFATLCPPDALRGAGLVDAAGAPTPLADAARVRALMVLPGALSEADRLALVAPLARLAAVDGAVELREQSFVVAAGQMLALSLEAIARHLEGTGVRVVRGG